MLDASFLLFKIALATPTILVLYESHQFPNNPIEDEFPYLQVTKMIVFLSQVTCSYNLEWARPKRSDYFHIWVGNLFINTYLGDDQMQL